ncbi:MAG: hypothetical protein ACNA8H_12625, partial [Anaerolineales bacterium]
MRTIQNFGFSVVVFICSFLLLLSASTFSFATVCSRGVAEPPFLNVAVKPNLLLMIDNSASMFDLAYVNATIDPQVGDASGYCYDDTYTSANSYAGYFEADTWYVYESNKFVVKTEAQAAALCSSATYKKTTSGVDEICMKVPGDEQNADFAAKGNFLNWAASSKMDIEKKILTGGKYDATDNVLVMESRGCLERRFIKKTAFDSGGQLTLAVSPTMPPKFPLDPDADYTTSIEIFPVTATGYNHEACKNAVEEMRKESPNQGLLKGYIDACMGFPSG